MALPTVDQKIEAHDYAKEIRETAARVEYRIKFGVTQDPEDYKLLRSAVGDLVELAEEVDK